MIVLEKQHERQVLEKQHEREVLEKQHERENGKTGKRENGRGVVEGGPRR